MSQKLPDLPNVDSELFAVPATSQFSSVATSTHAPRFLLLYGSLREKSYSRFLTMEAARLLEAMGGEVRIFNPSGLPLPDGALDTHPKVQELRTLAQWAEGMVWTSQGKTLAVMEVSGGSQSFNAVNQLRVLGRWMRMITIPNQSSVAKAFLEFDDTGRMKASAYYDRVVDVMEELFKFTLLTRDVAPYLVDRYSERKENAEELSKRVNQRAI